MTVVEIAPDHKVGLALSNPVMPAAGCFGFGAEYAKLVEMEPLGAIVVGPVTAGPRRGARPPRTVPTPGVAAILRRCARVWARCPAPVIVHVAGTSPEEVASCCRQLAGVEPAAGIELGLAEMIDVDDAVAITQAARATSDRPLIVRLPLVLSVAKGLAGVEALCTAVVEAGADALTIAAPPRGTAWHAASGQFVTGRLYGPAVLPQTLRVLRHVAACVSVPLIGCGGIHSTEDALAFLRAGAAAVQVDGALWRDPVCLARIACALSSGGS